MRKLITAVVALLLVAALMMSALAATMYVAVEDAKVYKKNSKKSDVISRLPFGGSVEVIEISGNWSHINYINKKGVQRSGWIASKNLSATAPHKHTWSEWKVTKKATCSKAGEKQRYCTQCGVTQTKETKKAKHTWGKWTVTKAATCAAQGERTHKCKVCDKKETQKIKKTAHAFGAWSVEQQATCAAKGTQSRVCTVCGFKQTETVDPLPHTFGDWISTVKLTRDTDGQRLRTCALCGFEEREVVKAEPTLDRGDRGETVKAVQTMLNEMGYSAGGADGVYGPKLDKAFGAFAADCGVPFEAGQLRPTQLDALVNGWIGGLSQQGWSESGPDAPVDLVLTVDSAGETDDVRTFNWVLSNQGAEHCTLKAVLMGAGADHNFRSDNMVAVLDSEKLKTGTANSLGGTFSVPVAMGDDVDALSFCAVVESDKTGERWISNIVNCTL